MNMNRCWLLGLDGGGSHTRVLVRSLEGDGTGYQRIALEPSSVAGSEDAARWEFLLERPEGIQHKLDLGAVCGGKGYGLLVEAPTEEWAGYETQLLGVLESFECL